MADDSDGKRGPGRPRKWANDAERMRAYRAKVAHERAVVKAGGTYVEMAEQIEELTRQRDKNWAQVTRLQEQVKALKRDQPARRSVPVPVRFDNPDDAAEAAFETGVGARRGESGHADCDAEIARLEAALDASERHNADLKTIAAKLDGARNSKPTPASQPAMSRAQRREAERQAKRRQRRS